ncbi:MAG TPA: FHA domain-containing protein, partial [Thermoanaerobaculia bacterium]|nr:FHA domain-containing protein [Thermoanaerobaculia bacterium]
IRLEGGKFATAKIAPGERSERVARAAGLSQGAEERMGELLAATRGTLTTAAVEKNIVTPAGLAVLAAAAVTEAAIASLLLDDADVEVSELDGPLSGGLDLTLDDVLAEAEKRRKDAAAITPATVFRTAGEPDLEKVTLTAGELKLLLRIDAKRNVEELAGGSAVAETVALLEKLLALGLIERGEERATPSVPVAPPKPAAETGPAKTLSGRPAGGFSAACLTIHDDAKTSFPLFDPEYTIGRDASNDIAIPDRSISSRHARIRRTPDGYELEDLGSTNGSFVNGERIERAVLRNDDAVRLGTIQMVYTIAEAARRPDETKRKRP